MGPWRKQSSSVKWGSDIAPLDQQSGNLVSTSSWHSRELTTRITLGSELNTQTYKCHKDKRPFDYQATL